MYEKFHTLLLKNNVTPVSYTHLDVYKRQDARFPGFFQDALHPLVGLIFQRAAHQVHRVVLAAVQHQKLEVVVQLIDVAQRITIPLLRLQIAVILVNPVSYTHLSR